LVAGTLAVSGGGILSTGGRLGVDPVTSASPAPASTTSTDESGLVNTPIDPNGETVTSVPEGNVTQKLDYTCEAGAIKDLGRGKWILSQARAGSRIPDGHDLITFELSQNGGKAKKATVVRMDWMDPNDARTTYGAPSRVQGSRALVLTFDGQVDVPVNQVIDASQLESESVDQIRNIQTFQGSDGKVYAVIGLRSDSCAALEGKGWGKKSKGQNSRVLLKVERF
jgi:hypothetical protein